MHTALDKKISFTHVNLKMATLVGCEEMFHTIMQCGILSYQVRSGRLSVRSKGNFLKWLCAKLNVVKDGGRDPGSTSLR